MHLNSYQLMDSLINSFFPEELKGTLIYDIGSCDVNGTYKPLIDKRGGYYQGVDIARGPNVDVVVTEYDWRLPKTQYIISGQCVEHVSRPWEWFQDIAETLLDGGKAIIIAPSAWPYHPFPIDCYRYYPEGFKALCANAGLDVIDVGMKDAPPLGSDTWVVCGKPRYGA